MTLGLPLQVKAVKVGGLEGEVSAETAVPGLCIYSVPPFRGTGKVSTGFTSTRGKMPIQCLRELGNESPKGVDIDFFCLRRQGLIYIR